MAIKTKFLSLFYIASIVAGSGLQSYATAPSGSDKISSYERQIQEFNKEYGGSHISSLFNEDYNNQMNSLHAQINAHNQHASSQVPLSEGYDQTVGSAGGSSDEQFYHAAAGAEPSYKSEMWQSQYAPNSYTQESHNYMQNSPQLQYYETIEQHQPQQESHSNLDSPQEYNSGYSQHYPQDTGQSQKYNHHTFENHDSGISSQMYQHQDQSAPDNQHQVDVINYVPVPVVKKLHVPYRSPVQIPVSHTVIIPVPKPVPIHIPITKQVQVPVEKELKIPVERLVPYPVEKKIPYPVEKRVPFQVVKYVPVKVHKPYPIKVPVVKTVLHKVKGWW